jgi:predicted TIM-barrel enzyme
MATVKIESLDREITLLPFTRAMSRAINEKLLEGVIVKGTDSGQQTDIPAINADRAEELAVKLVSGLTSQEMDSITDEDYKTLKAAVNDVTSGKKK